jgi:hypothetical protein
MENHFFTKATQLALKTAGKDPEATRKILDLSRFRGPDEIVFSTNESTGSYSFFLIDVTLDENLQWRIIEANGSNAALSSTALGGETARLDHLLQLFLSKPVPGKAVILFAHQYKFIHLSEFFNRSALFAQNLSAYHDVELIGANETPKPLGISVVAGNINDLAKHISAPQSTPMYYGYPIMLASNANLLPELERLNILQQDRQDHPFDQIIFQEQGCTSLIHDKSLQQECAVTTGIVPVRFRNATDVEMCYTVLKQYSLQNKIAVAKMNAGSGGAGIDFFEPNLSSVQIEEKLIKLVDNVRQKYSSDADRTMFPIRFFEFVKAKPLIIKNAPHLWDMRLQVLVYPEKMEIRPCVVRACPAPFDGSYAKPTVVNNLSGRIDPEELAAHMHMNPYQKISQIHQFIDIPQPLLNALPQMLFAWAKNAVCLGQRDSKNRLDD